MALQSQQPSEPPKWAQRFLNWFIRENLAEEVLGDLEERYLAKLATTTKSNAQVHYCFQVLNYLRPFAIKPHLLTELNPFFMLRHNLKISFRTLVRDSGFSLINIGGLALGMTIALLVSLWVWDELSFNDYHEHKDRIVQVMRHQSWQGERSTSSSHPTALAQLLKEDYTNYFENLVMVRQKEEYIISFEDRHFSELGNFMQEEAPRLFNLNMIIGTYDGLKNLKTILLSQSLADKLFGSENPINQTVKLNGAIPLEVTGVYEDLPQNSTFHETQFISPLELYLTFTQSDPNTWSNYNMRLYGKLMPNTILADASAAIGSELKNNMEKEAAESKQPELFLHPMEKWHLYGEFEQGQYATSNALKAVWTIGLIGLFVLLLAGINFVNLSTARSEKRAKEIGVRKSLGSRKTQLFFQFMSESLLVAFLALFFSFGLLIFILPSFNQLAGKTLSIPFTSIEFWFSVLGLTFLTGILAGCYPALYLSSFQPVQSLKGWHNRIQSAVAPRKVLVVFQFTISIALLIGTILIYQHIEHAKQRPTGYAQEGLLMLPKQTAELYGQHDVYRQALKGTGGVLEIATANYPLTNTRGNNNGFDWTGKDPSFDPSFNTILVNHEYGETVNWELIAGRDFSREYGSDNKGVVITQSAQQLMGFEEAVGKTIRFSEDWFGGNEFTILGVVNDLVKESPFQSTMPAIMFLSEDELPWLFVRLNPALETETALKRVANVFRKLAPNSPFDFKFVDAEYAAKFEAELKMGKLARFFAILAILISCLGVFGLATYFAERRTKEISIRKVLGASTWQLWHLLSKDFVFMVLFASGIAIPIAWYFFNRWLLSYEYRTSIAWWVFLVAILITLAITLLTVSYQSIKAALAPPVAAIKTE